MITGHLNIERSWPEVAPHLHRYLRARGATAHDADDVVQECAVRVLESGVAYDDPDQLLKWCYTVARNLHVDLIRKQAWLTSSREVDVACETDVHRCVAARLDLLTVLKAWPRLSSADRQSLVTALHADPRVGHARKEAVRLNVARHRARQRLAALIASTLGVVLGAGRFLRDRLVPFGATATIALAAWAWALPLDPELGRGPSVQEVLVAALPAELAPARGLRVLPAPDAPTSHDATPHAAGDPKPLLKVSGPRGNGLALLSHDRRGGDVVNVCVGGLPLVADTCVRAGSHPRVPAGQASELHEQLAQ